MKETFNTALLYFIFIMLIITNLFLFNPFVINSFFNYIIYHSNTILILLHDILFIITILS